jgi:hypothetical protein
MLYFDQEVFSEAEYVQYEDFFTHEWPKILSKLKKQNRNIRNYIIGLVQGAKDDFITTFRGLDNGVMYNLDIAVTGNVSYHEEKGSLGFTGTGLSEKVQNAWKNSLFSTRRYANN